MSLHRHRRLHAASAMVLSLLVALASLPSFAATPADGDYNQAIRAGDALYQHGQTERALSEWSKAYELATASADRAQAVAALARRAEAYAALGYYRNAAGDLDAAIAAANARGDAATEARLQGRLGNVLFLAGDRRQGEVRLRRCLGYAEAAGDAALQARTLNDLGNLLAADRLDGADDAYRQSIALAREAGDEALAATALLNGARYLLERNNAADGAQQLDAALSAFRSLPDSSMKAGGLLGAARLTTRFADEHSIPSSQAEIRANGIYREAAELARRIGDRRALSYALGYRGGLYERRDRRDEASALTRQALFEAQQAGAPEIVYLWQWQLARLHRASGEVDLALAEYRQARTTLQHLRGELLSGTGAGRRSLYENTGTVYLEFADLLLSQSSGETDEAKAQAMLLEARETMELFKTAEIENYFQDDCVANLQAKAASVDELSGRAAAVYPIMLPDRIELLVSLPGRMVRVTSPTSRDDVLENISRFQYLLGKRTFQYRQPAEALYAAFITPIESELESAEIDTLVFVPDAALRTIPLSALHDGKRHLIEKYAIAVTPGLTLFDPRPISSADVDLLLGGLSEGVQGFSPLPHVTTEISNLESLYGGEVFQNENFVTLRVERALNSRPFTVVHLATHAKFEADARSSYLLTYDGRLSMDQLENLIKLSRFREEPVELLTLSACDTAVGDERAALGLAGVAIKAGARSAVASLWLVNDQAASVLISKFYSELTTAEVSKAQALQRAQVAMINNRRYRFPVYWAPFLMIGNWL